MKCYYTAGSDDHGPVRVRATKNGDGEDVMIWLWSQSMDVGIRFDVEGARHAIQALTEAVAEAEELQAQEATT